jgi:hypothetical protein
LLLVAMAGGGADEGAQARSDGGAAPLPEPIQLPPQGNAERLTRKQVAFTVSRAQTDRELKRALRQGRVRRVLVRAAPTGAPGDRGAGLVAFLFDAPVRPSSVPWEVLCDIGGQTEEWKGVAARVLLEDGEVESSPVWLTGANCVGMRVPR